MSHTTHHDGCDCFVKKMQELESKLAKAIKALEFYSSDGYGRYAQEVLKEIGTDRDKSGQIGT